MFFRSREDMEVYPEQSVTSVPGPHPCVKCESTRLTEIVTFAKRVVDACNPDRMNCIYLMFFYNQSLMSPKTKLARGRTLPIESTTSSDMRLALYACVSALQEEMLSYQSCCNNQFQRNTLLLFIMNFQSGINSSTLLPILMRLVLHFLQS